MCIAGRKAIFSMRCHEPRNGMFVTKVIKHNAFNALTDRNQH